MSRKSSYLVFTIARSEECDEWNVGSPVRTYRGMEDAKRYMKRSEREVRRTTAEVIGYCR
jgi:hypothetical protein